MGINHTQMPHELGFLNKTSLSTDKPFVICNIISTTSVTVNLPRFFNNAFYITLMGC